MDKTHARLDEINEQHIAISARYDALFEECEKCNGENEKIKKIFAEEANSFFNERLKWKSDAKQQLEQQTRQIKEVQL